MQSETIRQTNFTGGELHPDIKGRRDFKGYYSSMLAAGDLMCEPQGPLVRRPGFPFIDFVRLPLQAVSLATATVTAPNGGTVADAVDPSHSAAMLTTNHLGTTDPYVVLLIDLGEEMDISAVDLIDFAVVDASAPATPEPPPVSYPFPTPPPGFPTIYLP